MNVFRFLDYREAISEIINEKKKIDREISYAKFADMLNIQKTYFSRVMQGKAHFSSDQLYLCCKGLQLNKEENDYMFLLLEYARSGVEDRKNEIFHVIQRMQLEYRKFQKQTKAQVIQPGQQDYRFVEYYLEPLCSVVHTYLTVPFYQKRFDKIGEELNLPSAQLEKILDILKKLGVIRWQSSSKHYEVLMNHIHLPKDSVLSVPAEQILRLMSMDHIKKLNKSQVFYYSFTFSANEKTRVLIHEELLKFLRKVEAEVKAAPAEKVYHLAIDLFPWSR